MIYVTHVVVFGFCCCCCGDGGGGGGGFLLRPVEGHHKTDDMGAIFFAY